MRASELLGRPVHDSAGRLLGIVIDLRCVQDGPLRGSMAAPRVDQLIVSPRRTGSMLGYHRPEQRGPWLIRTIVRWLHRNERTIAWDDVQVDLRDGGPIRLR
jgi:hypothetical protein